jgi:type II secretory pathway component PulM
MSHLRERIDNARLAWTALDARRRNLILLIVFGALALVAVALGMAQSREAKRLNDVLQQLARQEATFYNQANEAKSLLKRPASANAVANADVPALQTLAGEGVSVTAAPGGGFRLMSASMPYAKWWSLCAELDRKFGLTMSALELAPKQDVKQNVSFDMTLVPAQRGGRAP